MHLTKKGDMTRQVLPWKTLTGAYKRPYAEQVVDLLAEHGHLTYEIWHYDGDTGRYFVSACDLARRQHVWDVSEVKTLVMAKRLAEAHAASHVEE